MMKTSSFVRVRLAGEVVSVTAFGLQHDMGAEISLLCDISMSWTQRVFSLHSGAQRWAHNIMWAQYANYLLAVIM